MVLAVKIQNRETGKFYCKGGGWSDKGKAWTALSYAKTAICPTSYHFDIKELNSDFIIINDDGTVEKKPVALYFIDYFTRELKHCYNKANVLNKIGQIKKFCKENNIELEELENG